MSSLIADKVKTNMCLVSIEFFIVLHYLMCLQHINNNNYINNYLFVILICLQPFYKPHLYVIQLTTFSVSTTLIRQIFTYATETLHNSDGITIDCCPLYLTFLYTHTFSLLYVYKVKGSCSCLLENSIMTACSCSFLYLPVPNACCCCRKLFNIFVSVYLSIVYTLPLVAFAFVVFAFSVVRNLESILNFKFRYSAIKLIHKTCMV